MYQYRNVSIQPDGTIEGEHDFGSGNWIKFSASPKLMRIREALERHPELDEPIWALQDGYGEPGFMPPQGWDWSGIRDSSDEAIDAMYALASQFFTDEQFSKMLGVEV